MKPLVYVAGPYTRPDPIVNVRRACAVGDMLTSHGCAVIIPHLSMLWHLVSPQPIETWYERDLDVMRRCDAVVRLSGESTGADQEVEIATESGIPVFSVMDGGRIGSGVLVTSEFLAWLRDTARGS